MSVTNQFRSALRKALAGLPLAELEIVAEDARPDAEQPLPVNTTDSEVLARALIQACEQEGVLSGLLAAALARRPSDTVLQNLAAQLPGLLAAGASIANAVLPPAGGSLPGASAQRDLYVDSTIDSRQIGGARLGDQAHVGTVIGSAAAVYLGLRPASRAEGALTEKFDLRYLDNLLRYASLRPLLGGKAGPGHGGAGAITVPHAIHLADAFVPLSFAPFGLAGETTPLPPPVTPIPGRTGTPPPGNQLGPLLAANPRLVILGVPGAGKTTLLRHLAVLNAATWLAQAALPPGVDPEQIPDEATLVGLSPQIQDRWRRWAQLRARLWLELGWSAPLYPLLVNMRNLRDVRIWPRKRALHRAIQMDADALGFAGSPRDFFANRLRQGHTVVLLDALDELGSREARNRMATLIGTLLNEFQDLDDAVLQGNRVLVSARPVGYEDQLAAYGFAKWQIQPLDSAQQTALVRHYYAAFALARARESATQDSQLSPEAQERHDAWAGDLLERLGLLTPAPGRTLRPVHYRLRALADNPLLLSLIVSRHYGGYELPYDRERLYQVCVESLVQDWQRFKATDEARPDLAPLEERDPLSLNDKLELLGGLALLAQVHRTGAADQNMPILETEVEASLAERLGGKFAEKYTRELGIKPPVDSPEREEFWTEQARLWIGGIEAQAGLVRFGGFAPTGARVLEFAHLTFQEYLSAWALWRAANAHPAPEILAQMRKSSWQEVVLLYLLLQPAAADLLVQELLPEPGLNGLVLLGRILGERDLRANVAAAHQADILAALERMFQRPDESATRAERQAVAGVLQQISDQEPGAQRILDAALAETSDPAIRAGAAMALRGVAGDVAATGSVVTRLAALAFDPTRSDLVVQVRVAAAATVAALGDPRVPGAAIGPQSTPTLVPVEGTSDGGFQPGLLAGEVKALIAALQDPASERSIRRRLANESNGTGATVHLPAFEIGRYLVTNQEYALYVATGGRVPTAWAVGRYPAEEANYPVIGLDPVDIWAYCAWLTARLADGGVYRPPTEAEWEWVARGPERRLWPWGMAWAADACNSREAGLARPSAVGLFPAGRGWGAVDDLAGNVWELTATVFQPYSVDWLSTPVAPAPGPGLVLRGGSYGDPAFYCRTTTRAQVLVGDLGYEFGFRLVRLDQAAQQQVPPG